MDEYDEICEEYTPNQIQEKLDPLLDLNNYIKFNHTEETKQKYAQVRKKKLQDRLEKYKDSVSKIHDRLKQRLSFIEKDKLKEDLKYLVEEINDMENTPEDFFIKNIPDVDMIKIEKAIVDPSKYENQVRNVLVAYNVPKYLDENFLRNRFSRYTTKLRDRESSKKDYPIIKLYKENNKVIVVFSKESLDAEFCLFMIRKLYFTSPDGKMEFIMFKHLKESK
jgi:hypothetical protein